MRTTKISIETVNNPRKTTWGSKSSLGAPLPTLVIIDNKIAPEGIAKSRFDTSAEKSSFKSFDFARITMARMKLDHSIEILAKLRISTPRPNEFCMKGQNIWTPSFVIKSPTILCCISARKYGKLLFRYSAKKGMNRSVWITSE